MKKDDFRLYQGRKLKEYSNLILYKIDTYTIFERITKCGKCYRIRESEGMPKIIYYSDSDLKGNMNHCFKIEKGTYKKERMEKAENVVKILNELFLYYIIPEIIY